MDTKQPKFVQIAAATPVGSVKDDSMPAVGEAALYALDEAGDVWAFNWDAGGWEAIGTERLTWNKSKKGE